MLDRTRPLVLVLSLSAAVLALSACQRPDKPEAKADGKTQAAAAPALLIAPEDVRAVEASGLLGGPVVSGAIQPARRADLRAEVAAVVLQVAKDNGEAVRQGDVIVRLDSTAIRDNLTSAEEALRAATQSAEQTERVLVRQRTLSQQGMVSMQALEDAELRRNASQSDLAAAKARVVTARQQMTRTELRAPFDGVVSERKVSVGDTVQVGREIVKVIDPRSMRFEGSISADRLGELKLGQSVNFRVNGISDPAEFAGTLQRIDAAANAVTRQVEVVVAFANPAQAPQVAGLFAEGRVDSGAHSTLVIAEGSVLRQGDSTQVWKLVGGKLAKVDVQLGERDARRGFIEVKRGLAKGDEVLRAPTSTLLEGQAFQRVTAGAGAAKALASASAPK